MTEQGRLEDRMTLVIERLEPRYRLMVKSHQPLKTLETEIGELLEEFFNLHKTYTGDRPEML